MKCKRKLGTFLVIALLFSMVILGQPFSKAYGEEKVSKVQLQGNSFQSMPITLPPSNIVLPNEMVIPEVKMVKIVGMPAEINLYGQNLVKASVTAVGGASTAVRWTSSDPTVATVNSGLIKWLNLGKVTITATSVFDERIFDSISVTVYPCDGISVQITNVPLRAAVDEESLVGATVYNQHRISSDGRQVAMEILKTKNCPEIVKWTSSDNTKATVDSWGKIKWLKEGTVTITATSPQDSSRSAFFVITVQPKSPIESVEILEKTINPTAGSEGTLTAKTVSIEVEGTVNWASSDPSIATVTGGSAAISSEEKTGINETANAATIKWLKEGTVTITATSTYDPAKSDSFTVTVKKK